MKTQEALEHIKATLYVDDTWVDPATGAETVAVVTPTLKITAISETMDPSALQLSSPFDVHDLESAECLVALLEANGPGAGTGETTVAIDPGGRASALNVLSVARLTDASELEEALGRHFLAAQFWQTDGAAALPDKRLPRPRAAASEVIIPL